jgi:hypothetical protein
MDCGYYAVAYICRVLGHPEVTGDQVKQWRAETGFHEDSYPERALGHEVHRWREDRDDEEKRRRWWLGPGTEPWVRSWLEDGWIAHVFVHRRQDYGHAVALLDATDDAVHLMDPWPAFGGHITEPWEWFLGIGPGTHGCHHIVGWYRP